MVAVKARQAMIVDIRFMFLFTLLYIIKPAKRENIA
jgi:hypothetical protein